MTLDDKKQQYLEPVEKQDEKGDYISKSKSGENAKYESLKERTSIKIRRSHKNLLDYLAFEAHRNKIDFIEEMLEYYAKTRYPEVYQKFMDGKLKWLIHHAVNCCMTSVVHFVYLEGEVYLVSHLEGGDLTKEYYISLIDMIAGLKEEQ